MKLKALLIVLVLHFFTVAASAETVYLSAAASMTDALKGIITDFNAGHPKTKIQTNFGSSGRLAKQIDQGAPADLYISANPKWMNYLVGKKLIALGTDRIFAYNKLVFLGGKRSTPLTLNKLTDLERIALGSPQSVPAGQYAKQALEHAKIYRILEQKRKLVMAKDVRQALLYADRGEVDGAFVYQTDALLARTAKILFTVPDDLYDRVAYPLGLTLAGAKNTSAKALYKYMSSPEAKAVFKKYGFEVKN
ncbi:molybdate ABC transporter substrate-binding protein [Candidatus Electrothrix laxa]